MMHDATGMHLKQDNAVEYSIRQCNVIDYKAKIPLVHNVNDEGECDKRSKT